MAIKDLITSDPYYVNLVKPRGFPTGNDVYVPPTSDDPEPVQTQPEYGLQSIINPYLPQNQGNGDREPFDPLLQQLIEGKGPKYNFENIPNNNFYENENSIVPNNINNNFYENENSIVPNNINNNFYENENSIAPNNVQPEGILQSLQSKISGLRDFLPFGDKSLTGLAAKGLKSVFERDPTSPTYERYDPTGKIDYSKLNTINLNDFYDSNPESETFGTTRFDRAAPGSFGSFRTLADYFNRNKKIATTAKTKRDEKKAAEETKKRNEKIAADKIAADKAKAANQAFQDAMANQQAFYASLNEGQGASSTQEGRDNAGGGAAANRGDAGSGWDSSPFARGGRVRYRDGGIASMFTRRG